MSNYTAPAAPTVTPAAPASNPPAQVQGGPYLPQTAVLGGVPEIGLDVPICAVFMAFFIAAATFHMAIFQINRRHGYKFLFSGLLFGFCMARIVALSTRIVWATHPHNIRVAIASQIFTAAGVILLFITNLIFAQRIIRAFHPFFGWSRPVSWFFGGLFFSIVAILVMVTTATVHSFFTLDPAARRTDRTIQLFSGVYLGVVAFLPIPLALLAGVVPRRTRIDKFGQGHFRTKFALLVLTACLLATGAVFRATANFFPRPSRDPAWFQGKACYYCFNFAIEVVVVYIYALSRFDRRFHVPDGSSAPGHYSCSEDGRTPVHGRSARSSAASSARHLALSTGELEKPVAAHLYSGGHSSNGNSNNSKRASAAAWSGLSRRSTIVPASTTTRHSGVPTRSSHQSGGRPRSTRSLYIGSGGEAARSEADVVTLEADLEWMARAMRELYADDGVVAKSGPGRQERNSHGGGHRKST